jgi:hypothetical protein
VSLEEAVPKVTPGVMGSSKRLRRDGHSSFGTWRVNRSLPGGHVEVGMGEENQDRLHLQRPGGPVGLLVKSTAIPSRMAYYNPERHCHSH